MFEHRDPSRCKFRTYEVEAASFELHEGTRISPGRIIGKEISSGETVRADCWSQVATAYFNPMNDSYLVMTYLMDGKEKRLFELQLA